MSNDEITEREQHVTSYCEHISRICAQIDHNSEEERPHNLIRETQDWDVVRQARREVRL